MAFLRIIKKIDCIGRARLRALRYNKASDSCFLVFWLFVDRQFFGIQVRSEVVKLVGLLLLLAGWVLVLAAVVLLAASSARAAFVLAGTGVEGLGLALVFRSHLVLRGSRD